VALAEPRGRRAGDRMTESRIDFGLHTIMVRVGDVWRDARFMDDHRVLQNAAEVTYNRHRAAQCPVKLNLKAAAIRDVEDGLSSATFPRCLCRRDERNPDCRYHGDAPITDVNW
jgi:hypothetical protein